MKKGKTVTLKIKGTTQKITWSSNNKSVATVNSKGKVTAKKNGTATITAKVGKSKYKCKITVGNVVKISETEHAINVGENFTLKITGTSEKITWSSSDTSIATVDKNGKVTAKKEGTATITATISKTKYTCEVYVENLTPWWLNESYAVQKGHTLDYSFDTKQKVSWSSSDTNIAKIDSKGVITGVNVGTATITAKVGNKKFDSKIYVREFKKDITMTTKVSNYGEDTVVAYFKNSSSLSYRIDATIYGYDANGKEVDTPYTSTYNTYSIIVRAGATIAYPLTFWKDCDTTCESYKITALENDYLYVTNVSKNASKVTLGLWDYDKEKYEQGIFERTEDLSKFRGGSYGLWAKNDSDKRISNIEYCIVGYNESGEVIYTRKDEKWSESAEPNSKTYFKGSSIFPAVMDDEKHSVLYYLTPSRVECYVLNITEE